MGALPQSITTEELAAALMSAAREGAGPVAVECLQGFDAVPAVTQTAAKWAREDGAALVVCADAVLKERAGELLANARGASGAAMAVAEATELAAAMVETWGAQAGCPRTGRLLDANEMDVLIEDVKVSGLKTGRLKEMLKFFRKSISDSESRNSGWLATPEEQKVFAILEENLEARAAIMPCEAAGFALSCLNSPAAPDAADALLAPLFPAFAGKPVKVFALDFGAMNRCAQELCLALAQTGIVACGNQSCGCAADEPYPNPEGFAQFKASASTTISATGIAAQRKAPLAASSPSEEFAAVALAVAGAIGTGTPASAIVVAVPNRIWAANIEKALAAQGVESRIDFGSEKAKGDPRLPGRHDQLRQATLAKLARNPRDLAALRTWLGLGDWLLASDAFLELMAWARDHHMAPFEALEHLRQHPEEGAEMKLFHKLGRALDALPGQLDQARRQRQEPGLQERPASGKGQVTIASYGRCRNRKPQLLVIAGMVDGFLPRPDAFSDKFTIDHQCKALKREQALLEDLLNSGGETVVQTLFERDLLENADALGARITRITMEGDARVARIAPSCLLDR